MAKSKAKGAGEKVSAKSIAINLIIIIYFPGRQIFIPSDNGNIASLLPLGAAALLGFNYLSDRRSDFKDTEEEVEDTIDSVQDLVRR